MISFDYKKYNVIPTFDPHVFIEEQRPGYIRYWRIIDGRRWEVYGTCDYRGDCLIGSSIDGETVRDHAHLNELKTRLGVERLVSEMDVPVTPEFEGCCPFTYVELEPRLIS